MVRDLMANEREEGNVDAERNERNKRCEEGEYRCYESDSDVLGKREDECEESHRRGCEFESVN